MLNLKKRFILKVIVILSFWFLSFLCLVLFSHCIKLQLEKHTQDLVEKLSFEIESEFTSNDIINTKFNILETVANDIIHKELSTFQEITDFLGTAVGQNQLERIAIAKNDGIAYYDNGEIIDISDKDYFKSSIDGKKYVSSIFLSELTGEKNNIFSIPIFKENKIVGVLCGCVLSDELLESLKSETLKQISNLFIINTNGDIISFIKNDELVVQQCNLFNELNESDEKQLKANFKNMNKGSQQLTCIDNTTLSYFSLGNDLWLISILNNQLLQDHYYSIMWGIKIFNIVFITITSIIVFILLVQERKNYKDLEKIAYTDNVTGGKNDSYLKNNIFDLIKDKGSFAFISFEITNIKIMITLLGIKNTENMLKKIYTYLEETLRKDEVIVHSYLGEFKLLIKYSELIEIIRRIEKINFDEINSNVKFIIGIYLIDDSASSYEDMCSYVNIAKETLNIKNNYYMIYNKQMHKKEIERIKLEEDIIEGIAKKEFKAWFQPKYGEDGKTIVGAEALVRWYKDSDIMLPYVFIPMCEANNLIKEIDELVLEDVCKNLRKWIDEGKKIVPISINLSRSYLDNVNCVDKLDKYMNQYNIDKKLVEFEITESSLIENEERLKQIVALLHEKGYKVLVDDFGIGYSSIKSISSVDFDIMKIDKSFIDEIGVEKWEDIIRYTINIASTFGMSVIAEGVETKEQYDFLLKCNCRIFQGYYFNKPMDSSSFSHLI